MRHKKGVSAVIATVLLIMLTVAAASMIYVFVVPMIKNMLESSQTCYDLRGQVMIEIGRYTCADETNTSVQIRIGEESKGEILGFLVVLDLGGTSKSYRIKNNTETGGVKMHSGATFLKLPSVGGAETYIFNGPGAESVRVAPIAGNGKVCEAVEEKIGECG